MLHIKLTDLQLKELSGLNSYIKQALKVGSPGSILGQVYPSEGYLTATFVPNEVATEITNVLKKHKMGNHG